MRRRFEGRTARKDIMPNRLTLLLTIGALLAPSFQCPAAAQNHDDGRPSKRFEWLDQRAGDCHQSGVLTLYPDGRAVWSATTWTDHSNSGDVWHETLKVLNSQKPGAVRFRRLGFAARMARRPGPLAEGRPLLARALRSDRLRHVGRQLLTDDTPYGSNPTATLVVLPPRHAIPSPARSPGDKRIIP